MEDIALLVLGILISIMGIVNCTGNISTIHSYNRRNVKEEDIPHYGKAIGIGSLIIGLALIVAYILKLTTNLPTEPIILPAFIVAILVMLYGQIKYNKGLF